MRYIQMSCNVNLMLYDDYCLIINVTQIRTIAIYLFCCKTLLQVEEALLSINCLQQIYMCVEEATECRIE